MTFSSTNDNSQGSGKGDNERAQNGPSPEGFGVSSPASSSGLPGVPAVPAVPALIITLDGPAGSGKSTVARKLAHRLGVDFLDTGAMYRGLAALCLDGGIEPTAEPERVIELLGDTHMHFDWQQDPPRLHVNDVDVSGRIRDKAVTTAVSEVAAISQVRQQMVQWQRRIGRMHPRLVTEGRDQGSVVFTDAHVKFYLVASAQVRADRRTRELNAAGKQVDMAEILADIQKRDHRDMTRTDGPLVKPNGAIEVDTSPMTLDQVVDYLHKLVLDNVPHHHVAASSRIKPNAAGKAGDEAGHKADENV